MRNRAAAVPAAFALALAFSLGAWAELSVDPVDNRPTTILATIADGPDPFGSAVWSVVRSVPPERTLNASGEARGDGRPDIAWDPESGRPVVVWAYNAGSDFDIAFSEWTGEEWSGPEFLTAGTGDELDPRVFVEDDGTIHVSWWETGPMGTVCLTTRHAHTQGWGPVVPVTRPEESGRRPSVAMWQGTLRVAYERVSMQDGAAQEVVVSRRETDGTFVPEVVALTNRTERLDILLHVEADGAWTDWKHSEMELGYSESGAQGWGGVCTEPLNDPSWLGVEESRQRVRTHVLSE